MSKFSIAKVVPEILELFLCHFFLKDFQVKAISFLALDKQGHMGNPAPKINQFSGHHNNNSRHLIWCAGE